MIDAALLWWADRSGRERTMLSVMGALLAIALLWFTVLAPVFRSAQLAQIRHDQAVTDAATVANKARALKAAMAAPPAALDGPLQAIISQSAGAAGFALSRADAVGTDAVSITLVSAKSPAFFAWLNGLNDQGVFADQISIRTNNDATIAVDAVLRAQVR